MCSRGTDLVVGVIDLQVVYLLPQLSCQCHVGAGAGGEAAAADGEGSSAGADPDAVAATSTIISQVGRIAAPPVIKTSLQHATACMLIILQAPTALRDCKRYSRTDVQASARISGLHYGRRVGT